MSFESNPESMAFSSKKAIPNRLLRLRKHADYQRVYGSSKKQFSKQIAFFYSLRPETGPDGSPQRWETGGPRIGLTVGKVMGKAVDRNRIKRRMRECIRRSAGLITAPVDVVLHPRRIAIDMEFSNLEREVAQVFRTIQAAIDKKAVKQAGSAEIAGRGRR
jgi:ribonuclease P protein component